MNLIRLLVGTLAALLIMTACAAEPTAEPDYAMVTTAEATAVEEMQAQDEGQHSDMDSAGTQAGDMDRAGHDVDMAESVEDDAAMADNAESAVYGEIAGEKTMHGSAADNAEAETASVERPAWQQIALTDSRTGEQFSLADHAGKVVFVEPFATWCSNCRRQLGNVQTAHAALAGDAVFIALSVEPNIADGELLNYADKQGFAYTFAAMPPEMLQELSAIFGQTIANPPATPHFIIRPDGSTTEAVTGFEDADVLVQQIEAAAE